MGYGTNEEIYVAFVFDKVRLMGFGLISCSQAPTLSFTRSCPTYLTWVIYID